MKEGVPPVDKSNVAAQLNSSNLENIRLQRQIQDLKRAERNNAARDVAAAVIPAELPFYQHMLPVASASVQSAISSLSTPRQMKKLCDKELIVDIYFRHGSEEQALMLTFPTLSAPDAGVVMAAQPWTQHHSNSQKSSRRRYWKNGGR